MLDDELAKDERQRTVDNLKFRIDETEKQPASKQGGIWAKATMLSALSLELKNAEAKLQADLTSIDAKGTEDRKVIMATDVQKRLDNIKLLQNNVKQQENAELAIIDDALLNKGMRYDVYEKKKKAIIDKYNEEALSQTKDYLQEEINLLKSQGVDVTKLQEQLNSTIASLGTKRIQTATDQGKLEEDKKTALTDQWVKFSEQAISTVKSLTDDAFNTEMQQLQRKYDMIQTNSQAELDAINASTLSAEQKALRTQQIDGETAAKQKAIQAEMNALKRKQAAADKIASEAAIIENTAVAVMSAYAKTVTIPLVPLIIATGAVQLATAMATPLPAYEHGTGAGGHPGGLAEIGEKGKKEYVFEPNKPAYSVNKPQIRNLPKGTHVIPESKIGQVANQQLLNAFYSGIPVEKGNNYITADDLDRVMGKTGNDIVHAIYSKQPVIYEGKPLGNHAMETALRYL